MSQTVQHAINTLWRELTQRLRAALDDQQDGVGFFPWEVPEVHRTNKAVVTLDRTVTLEAVAIRESKAVLTAQFGCMVKSGESSQGKDEAESLGYWLTDFFLSDPFLGGLAQDSRVEGIQLDADSVTDEGQSSHWVVVTAIWEAAFTRP